MPTADQTRQFSWRRPYAGLPPRSNVAVRGIVLLAGMAALAAAGRQDYDDVAFYWASATVALCWTGGWLLSGPRLARAQAAVATRALVWGVAAGGLLALISAAGLVLVRDLPVLGDSARQLVGSVRTELLVPLLITAAIVGISEELLFRDAAFRWFTTGAPVKSTALFVAVTGVTMSPALIIAAAVLGGVCAYGRQRHRSVLAPIAAHLTWTAACLLMLPPLVS